MKNTISKIRITRLSRGYTQSYMAIQLGIEQRTYSKLENGYIKLSVSRLKNIAAILEVETASLL